MIQNWKTILPHSIFTIVDCVFSAYLILPLASRVIKVAVTPVIVDSLISLLVHPVKLIGAALHVVTQAQQVALAIAGKGLGRRKF